jgi:toxin HigB-1
VIKSFADNNTELVFHGQRCAKLPSEIQQRARLRLIQLHSSSSINDLRIPPGNRLEKLVGDRSGEWSVRINQQWRIVFRWDDGDALEVKIEDYH